MYHWNLTRFIRSSALAGNLEETQPIKPANHILTAKDALSVSPNGIVPGAVPMPEPYWMETNLTITASLYKKYSGMNWI